jgi:hypothetical protein
MIDQGPSWHEGFFKADSVVDNTTFNSFPQKLACSFKIGTMFEEDKSAIYNAWKVSEPALKIYWVLESGSCIVDSAK